MKSFNAIFIICSVLLLSWSIKNLFKVDDTLMELGWCFSIALNTYNAVLNISEIKEN